MKNLKVLGIALFATAFVNAQDLEPAKKAIDAEKYENAKMLLKSILQTKPENGKANFLLGTVYLKQSVQDSAKMYFDKSASSKEMARFGNIGLAQLDLDKGDAVAAQAKFDAVMKDLRKKDLEELIYIGKAYINSSKPNAAKAVEVLNKAKDLSPLDANVQLALGDAHFANKTASDFQSSAYSAYRNAYNTDATLIRGKMQQGVLLKYQNFTQAVENFNEVLGLNANYGPAYRELAEIYYFWGRKDKRKFDEYVKKALGYYEDYMKNTDYSLSSRMRHADFLIQAKDYKAVEVEAEAMKKLDKVNPRILLYLGYAALENGNIDVALNSISEFVSKPTNRIIPSDYFTLARAYLAKGTSADGKTTTPEMLTNAITNFKKAVELEPSFVNDLGDLGKKQFSQKNYAVAASILELGIENPKSENKLSDNLYYGISTYLDNASKEVPLRNKESLAKADKSMDAVIVGDANYQDAYYYKAKINDMVDNNQVMAETYQKFIDIVTAKGAEEVTKNKSKFTQAYNGIGSYYADVDKVKAKEFFNKTLALDPTNEYATKSLAQIK